MDISQYIKNPAVNENPDNTYDMSLKEGQKLKLIGSKMEDDFREGLIKSHEYHFSANSKSRLKQLLESKKIDVSNAYIIGWTPDQTDDLFLVLIDGSWLLRVELERYDETVGPESIEDDGNWLSCEVDNMVFKGRGGPEKLEEIIKIFLDWAESCC